MMGSIGVGVRIDVAGGYLPPATVDHNAFAKFAFRDTIPRGTKIKDLDNGISVKLRSCSRKIYPPRYRSDCHAARQQRIVGH